MRGTFSAYFCLIWAKSACTWRTDTASGTAACSFSSSTDTALPCAATTGISPLSCSTSTDTWLGKWSVENSPCDLCLPESACKFSTAASRSRTLGRTPRSSSTSSATLPSRMESARPPAAWSWKSPLANPGDKCDCSTRSTRLVSTSKFSANMVLAVASCACAALTSAKFFSQMCLSGLSPTRHLPSSTMSCLVRKTRNRSSNDSICVWRSWVSWTHLITFSHTSSNCFCKITSMAGASAAPLASPSDSPSDTRCSPAATDRTAASKLAHLSCSCIRACRTSSSLAEV
mmetsp:Transcript_3442/g.8568  ORF Transcript_3442/g.8568 Transcript_3442/m.8568 type:complete len:288 (+) Transcript_3442:533-1396(+)